MSEFISKWCQNSNNFHKNIWWDSLWYKTYINSFSYNTGKHYVSFFLTVNTISDFNYFLKLNSCLFSLKNFYYHMICGSRPGCQLSFIGSTNLLCHRKLPGFYFPCEWQAISQHRWPLFCSLLSNLSLPRFATETHNNGYVHKPCELRYLRLNISHGWLSWIYFTRHNMPVAKASHAAMKIKIRRLQCNQTIY